MSENKKVKLWVVAANCICAVLWNINLFVDLMYGYTNAVSFVLHIVCAIIWDICAVLWVVRYMRSRTDKEEY